MYHFLDQISIQNCGFCTALFPENDHPPGVPGAPSRSVGYMKNSKKSPYGKPGRSHTWNLPGKHVLQSISAVLFLIYS